MKKVMYGLVLTLTGAVLLSGVVAYAGHSWGGYHWARTSNPFTLNLGDNLANSWDSYLATTSSDWSVSSVLDTVIVPGANARPKNCRATAGRVEICNSSYGKTGWLGIATVWASETHITQGVVKLNDTYFSKPQYNNPEWKNLVMCQEVAHALGLDHQDEDFQNPNLGSCMDYTNSPGTNQHPNQHDYDMLEIIYEHLDATSTIVAATINSGNGQDVDFDKPSEWGRSLKNDSHGKPSLYERDLGNGNKVFTFVVWADGE